MNHWEESSLCLEHHISCWEKACQAVPSALKKTKTRCFFRGHPSWILGMPLLPVFWWVYLQSSWLVSWFSMRFFEANRFFWSQPKITFRVAASEMQTRSWTKSLDSKRSLPERRFQCSFLLVQRQVLFFWGKYTWTQEVFIFRAFPGIIGKIIGVKITCAKRMALGPVQMLFGLPYW